MEPGIPANRLIGLEDFRSSEWMAPILEMHSMMRVPARKMRSFAHCTDRRGLVHRAEIESFKHWEYPWLLKYGGFRPGSSVLDCGCGRGMLQFYLASKGYKVSSMDISTLKSRYHRRFWKSVRSMGLPLKENQASAMNAIARRYGTAIDFRVGSIAKLPFEDGSFDYVYSISVLEHMDPGEDAAAVKEMARVLKKGGKLLITVDFSPVRKQQMSYDKSDILRLVGESGLYFDGNYDFDVADWERYAAELAKAFGKSRGCEVSSAGFILEKR